MFCNVVCRESYRIADNIGDESKANFRSNFPRNKLIIVKNTMEMASREEMVEMFQLGRMNFKK